MSDAGKPRLIWGANGHRGEYMLRFPDHDYDNYIPRSLERKVAEAVPGFRVDNRGSRLELVNNEGYGIPNHDLVVPALTALFPDLVVTICEPEAPRRPSPAILAKLAEVRRRRAQTQPVG